MTLVNNFAAVRQALEDAAKTAVTETAAEIRAEIKRSFREPKTGRTYRKTGGRIHRASAQGEAPAVDFGNLDQSIEIVSASPFQAVIGSDRIYAPILEGSLERESFAPAAEKSRGGFARRLSRLRSRTR